MCRGLRVLLLTLLVNSFLTAQEHTISIENTNYTLSTYVDGTREWVNYNRLRLKDEWQDERWFFTLIGDVEHYLGRQYVYSTAFDQLRMAKADVPFATQTSQTRYGEGLYYGELYRWYGGYMDEKHRISVGLQKISMGVGRIWNPTDLFNPKNPLALEPDEVFGVFALSYTYSFDDVSEVQLVAAEQEDHSYKYARRIKTNVASVDVALNSVESDDIRMMGYELEGEWSTYGIGLRSEGGWFEDKRINQEFFQAVFGADRAFENDSVVTAEWLHSSKRFTSDEMTGSSLANTLKRAYDYGALNVTYQIDPLLTGSLSGIMNMDDSSFYIGPYLEYSLSDESVIGCGAMLYGGRSATEFGDLGQTYYVKVKMTF